mmetsp:Transcript_21006/g.49928  ORF Transcript_21006/g.49928 Transcript_21006/m.49928 type:complete len:369 (+) Transcript_21006:65-1171(+)
MWAFLQLPALVTLLEVTRTVCVSDNGCVQAGPESPEDQDFFLQLALHLDAPSTEEVQHLVSLLLVARKECPKATEACLPALSELRLAVWPHVQAETNSSFLPWMPSGHLDNVADEDTQGGGVSSTRSMFYRHVFKAAGINTWANLHQVTKDFYRAPYAATCKHFHLVDATRRTAFAFVRDPISRFISGYSELEYRSRAAIGWPKLENLSQALQGHPVGSPERAAAFFIEFLQTGIENNGHVRPQIEFFLPVGGCSIPMDFIGRTEHLPDDWVKMFALQNETVPPFDNALATHFHDHRDRKSMESFLGLARADNSTETSAPHTGSRYLRALCWLFLADFAVFQYEIPNECQQEPMKSVLALVRKASKAS